MSGNSGISDLIQVIHFATVIGEQPIAERGERARITRIIAPVSSQPMAKSRSFHCHYVPEVSFSFSLFLSFALTFAFMQRCRRRRRTGKLLTP